MPKVLRPHAKGSEDIEGWKQSVQIDATHIQDIDDPSGGKARKVITSIPSPFARMHLFETAFEFVTQDRTGDLRQRTIYHTLVSQCLDLLEIVFNLPKFRQAGKNLQFHRWNLAGEVQKLKAHPKHRLLGETLGLYLGLTNPNLRSHFYGFGDLYLLYYNYRVIGGSSPFTLFFAAPDVEPLDLTSAKGYRFFEKPVALPDRPEPFQLYLHKLFLAYPPLREENFCRQMAEYLERSLKQRPDLEQEVNRMRLEGGYDANQFQKEYGPLLDKSNSPVVVKQVPLAGEKIGTTKPEEVSDFVIAATVPADERPPLVLKEGHYPGWRYVAGEWKQETKVPIKEGKALSDRVLPGLAEPYPYLAIGDFLEDYLLKLPYELNSARFNTGEVQYEADTERQLLFKFPYLLPIKKEYFRYFKLEDLTRQLKFFIEYGGVRVQLRIPVKRGEIVFERRYYDNPQNPKDASGREIPEKGKILTAQIGMGVFPFYKYEDQRQYNDLYKVMLVDLDISGYYAYRPYDLQFYVDNQPITESGSAWGLKKTVRVEKGEGNPGSTYYEVFNTHFDFAELVHPEEGKFGDPVKGLIIPRWERLTRGTKEYTFAIDFGTTNTHLAWTDSPTKPPRPFTISEEDLQVVLLNQPLQDASQRAGDRYGPGSFGDAIELHTIQTREFIPSIIDGSSFFQFPIRTAVCEVRDFSNRPTDLLGNINIGFSVNAENKIPAHTRYHTNLKWETDLGQKGVDRIDVFFRELLRLIRNKVALNDGIVGQTRIVWFAPLSLDHFSRNQFEDKWKTHFQNIFKTDRTPIYLTESAAPYYYLNATSQVVPGRDENLLNIDIGGGTTDLLFFVEQQPTYGSSFRFAGDALWGDGFNTISQKDNGFLQAFRQSIARIPRSEQTSKVISYFEEALKNPDFNSADVVNLLFTYDQVNGYQFSDELNRVKHLRLILLLHFAAIMYHSAQIIQALGIKLPRYITFSGKGSLYLNRLAGGSNLGSLERLTRLMLKAVTGEEPPANFRLVQTPNPKEATANGGVYYTPNVHGSTETQNVRLVGTGEGQEVQAAGVHYKDVDVALRDQVIQNAERFFALMLDTPEITRMFKDEFAIEADLPALRQSIQSKLRDSLNNGLNRAMERRDVREDLLNETLFFFPIKHTLYELSKEVFAQYHAQ
ncbi:hypothetical protein SAMN05421823_107128 [Catalinimonas alkaloidigena]|uniref:Uncharacterized protein n=1 Tax=Catalinimonas alkaloidigena TaxID=1075417 RepID=A0A1G9LPJ3_9BACT|nr:hypothetical protein [Catalinimonas alkaloidigena]SDL63969.1 hypothetical protein SAMN05421823_107128 [Catalinimonas alkaloidigena]